MIDVAIVGGGPSGLALAILLLESGHRVKVLESRTAIGGHSRAIGIHPPGLAVLDRLGVGAEAAARGVRIGHGVGISRGKIVAELSFGSIEAEHRFVLSLPQNDTVALLRARLRSLDPGALATGTAFASVDAHPRHLLAHTRDSGGNAGTVQCRFLVGADGTRSEVRRGAGAPFAGHRLPDTYLMGDFPESTEFGSIAALFLHEKGITESFPLPGNTRRWVCWIRETETASLPELIVRRTGHTVDAGRNSMLSRFTTANLAVRSMNPGDVLLIGDAAHEVSPIGGQGMTLGLLDAAGLAGILDAALGGRIAGTGLREELDAFSRLRLAAARRAAVQAHVNMALGRPLWRPATGVRDALARALFASDRFSAAVASTFTMTRGEGGR